MSTPAAAITTEAPKWRPVLNGERAARAADAIAAIRTDLLKRQRVSTRADLSVGPAGRALFFAYSADALLRDCDLSHLDRLLNQSLDALATERATTFRSLSLLRGFVGVAWTFAHLEHHLEPENAFNLFVDKEIHSYLSKPRWQGHYDLNQGLVGLGVYALERLPCAIARRCIERILHHLQDTAHQTSKGITWFTPPAFLSAPELRQFSGTDRFCNLGLSRGVAGAIAFLSQVCAARIATERATLLLRGAVSWLLAQPQTDGASAGFPYAVAPGETSQTARLAWCYGDLGIAVALVAAARALNDTRLDQVALQIARRAACRSLQSSEVIDACLCHGAAGAGHLFNRLWHATRDPVLLMAAEAWFERALDMRQPGVGIGGFRTWERNAWLHGGADGPKAWVNDPGFIAGAAGTGLALLAAITNVDPAWDRSLLTCLSVVTSNRMAASN